MALIRKKKPKKKQSSKPKPKPAALPPAKTFAPAKMERPQFEVPLFTPSKASVSTGKDFLKHWSEPKFNPEKEFLKTFKELTCRHRSWDVWSDFIVMSACALSNPVDKKHYDEREARYLRIIRKYNKEE
jgi:hypothetical protein